MKVAVISNLETQQGRSSFITLLSSVFSRSQHKKVTILSTGPMKHFLDSVEVKASMTAVKSVSVLKVVMSSSNVQEEEMNDYAIRIGSEEVYAYDIFSSTLAKDDLQSLFMSILKQSKSELVLVEVVGSPDEPFNKQVLESVDAIVNVFNHNPASIEAVRDYVDNGDRDIVRRTGFVCQKYDPDAISEAKLGKFIKMNARNFIVIPYNSVIQKECMNGTLNTLAKFICKGHSEVVNLRSKLLEVMQFLFDSPRHKYIKGVNEWHK